MSDAVAKLAEAVTGGGRRALAQAITLLESRRPADRLDAEALLETLRPKSGGAVRLGISGSPGVGKSTFIESLGKVLLDAGHRLAVLAVDPSSQVTGGSILGDRVRMEELSKNERVFIRPSPSGATLGGVARHTRESILACEAAGHDVVIVETVGVGQSETVVASMVDQFMILHLPNSGDEIQGMKKGILELADVVIVTKADGVNINDAKLAKAHLEQALSLSHNQHGEVAPVMLVSGLDGTGVADLWKIVSAHVKARRDDGAFDKRRSAQALQWFRSELNELLQERLLETPAYAALLDLAEQDVKAGRIVASAAARQVLDRVLRPTPCPPG